MQFNLLIIMIIIIMITIILIFSINIQFDTLQSNVYKLSMNE